MFGVRHGFRVCTGAYYLGGYIGDNESKRDWLRERTLTWEKNINTVRENAGKISPRELYHSGTCNSILMDIYLTRHLGHSIIVRRSGEYDLQNLFALYCLW